MLARCPSCRNTFSTEQSGRQLCPICGKPLLVPEPPGAPVPAAELVQEGAGTPWERRDELGFWTGWGQTLQQALLEPGRLFAETLSLIQIGLRPIGSSPQVKNPIGFPSTYTPVSFHRAAPVLNSAGIHSSSDLSPFFLSSTFFGFAVLTTSVFWAIGQLLERLLLHGQTERMRQMLATFSQNPDLARMLKRMLDMQSQASAPGAVLALAALTPVFTFVLLYLNAGVTHAVAALLRQAKRGFPATFAACAYSCAPLVLLAVPACGSIVGTIWLVVLTGVGMKVTHRISTGGAAASVLAPYFLLCCLGFLAMGTLVVTLQNTLGQP